MSLFMNNRPIVSKQYHRAFWLSKYCIASILFRVCRLLELNGCRRLTGAIIEHAVHMLDLIDDAAGDSAQNIPRHIIALCSHEVGGGHSTQGHSVIIGALVAHDAHTVHVGQGCIVLADLLIQTRLCDLLKIGRASCRERV